MKKIALINSVYNQGSTGRICYDLTQYLKNNGYIVKTFYGRNKNDSTDGVFFGSKIDTYLHGIRSRITDKHGLYSTYKTKKLICELEDFKPDLIILHNLHGYYLNISILLRWIKKNEIKVLMVFHDCWNFTGHCSHFSLFNCDKWQQGCFRCPAKKEYPRTLLFDNSRNNYEIKKLLFSEINDLTVVCPSNWLANLVQKSFFSNREIITIHNGIDMTVFRKRNNDFRTLYNLTDKKLILCIANVFDERKGLYDVVALNNQLCPDERIVMVGRIKGKVKLPPNILHLARTDSIEQLVDIYSSCDVMFNPTYEDNYPTINLEAVSCGLPVVCYRTGGAVESVDENFLIKQGDVSAARLLMTKLFMGDIKYDYSKRNSFSNDTLPDNKPRNLLNSL